MNTDDVFVEAARKGEQPYLYAVKVDGVEVNALTDVNALLPLCEAINSAIGAGEFYEHEREAICEQIAALDEDGEPFQVHLQRP